MNFNTIFKAIKKIYPLIEGGYGYMENQVSPADCIIWENTQYPKPEWSEIEALIPIIELEDAKNEKIAQLNQYYASDECWTFRLKSTSLKASLTKTADFFAKVLPAIDISFAVLFETDDKKIIQTNLSSEKAKKINAKIQLEASILVKRSKLETEAKILNCKTIEEIALIDVKKALGVIPREIEIDNI
ncbi:MAG: hypothetical protein RIR01_1248 [Bacteroidota bacterium]|jgi:predicted metalloenzyme YecM